MIKDYYKILGVDRDASELDIKKAYFRLIRTHTPDHDPEMFQQIREAYECLKEGSQDQGPVLVIPEDPIGKLLYEQVLAYMDRQEYGYAAKSCEAAMEELGESPTFLYLMGTALRRIGKSGKAVKACEKLVKLEPDDMFFQKELALAYEDRGFYKKAFPVFRRAYELGCRDDEFIIIFSHYCKENKQFDLGLKILFEMIESDKKRGRDDIPELLDAMAGLYSMDMMSGYENAGRINGLLIHILNQYSQHLGENSENIFYLLWQANMVCEQIKDGFEELLNGAIAVLDKALRSKEAREMLSVFRTKLEIGRMAADGRFCESLIALIQAERSRRDEDEYKDVSKFAVLDYKLCVLAEMPEILKEFIILEKEYKEEFALVADFAAVLKRGENLKFQKEKYLKELRRLDKSFSGCMYFDLYPHERNEGQVLWEDEDGTPYVRTEKKIGRNDPCPCGSGRKYKQCCGKGK